MTGKFRGSCAIPSSSMYGPDQAAAGAGAFSRFAKDPELKSAKENVMPSAPSRYAFKDERTQPAVDLLSRIPKFAPGRVVDLGCGPGYSTELIARLYPRAEIIGVDPSANALQTAQTLLPGIQFEQVDIGEWTPNEPYDLIFSNGALQWLPNHRNLVPKLLSSLKVGGFLALQIPNNLQEPNRILLRMVAADAPWAEKLLPIAKSEPNNEAYEDLYARLRPDCASMEIWETTYFHPLNGVWSIIAWMKASGLGPFLTPLDATERRGFLRLYVDELAREYPRQPDGKVLLRFRHDHRRRSRKAGWLVRRKSSRQYSRDPRLWLERQQPRQFDAGEQRRSA